MAWLDNIRNAMHPYDDDYIENEERAAEDEFSRQEDDIPQTKALRISSRAPCFRGASRSSSRATVLRRRKSRR